MVRQRQMAAAPSRGSREAAPIAMAVVLAGVRDFQLSQQGIRDLAKQAGLRTRFIYLKDVFGGCYLEGVPPSNRMQRTRSAQAMV